jgi:T5SS/PEP-CTERM-associated repeat protein
LFRARRRASSQQLILAICAAAWLHAARPPEAGAILSSNTGLNINQFLGAERFYNAGYTGTRAIQANVEAGHIWNGHNSLEHVTTRITGTGAVGSDRSHATRVGSALGGRWFTGDYFTNPSRWGIAFGADLWSGAIATEFGSNNTFNFTQNSIATTYAPILQTGSLTGGLTADVFNSSWGTSDRLGTDIWTRGIDGLINDNGTIGVVAAGNDGPAANTVGGIGAGYNSIVVAWLGNDSGPPPYDFVNSLSSRGPNHFAQALTSTTYTTISNVRSRVDIAAPGQNLTLANLTGNQNPNATVSNQSGTSFAAPLVAGGASLIVDAGKDLYAGNANAIDGRVVKSVLLNSADKITGWNNGQVDVGGVIQTTRSLDWASGAGRMNLSRAFDQYVTPQSGGLAGTTDLSGMAAGDIAPVGWDFGSVDALGTSTYFIDQLLAGGTSFTTTLSWFADRNTGSLSSFDGAAEEHLANLDLRVVQFDDPISRNIVDTVAESISLYNLVEHLSFVTPQNGYYGIQVEYGDAHWNFTSETSELFGLAWNSTALAGERFWINPAGGDFGAATNWNPTATPGAADVAVFNLGGSYVVQLSADVSNRRLRALNGEVTFALAQQIYTLTDESTSDPSIVIGAAAGDDAHVVFTGGTIVSVNAALGSAIGSSGAATITGVDSQWQNSDSLFVGGDESAAGGTGLLEISDGTVVVGDTLKLWPAGSVAMSGGKLQTATLDLADGTFTMTAGRLVVDEVIGNLELGGTLAPGDSPGMTSISGDYTQGAGGVLEIEIAGITAASQFDLLSIGGAAELAGTLAVSLLEGFMPSSGDVFEIVTAVGGISGTFANTFLPALSGDLTWQVDYSSNVVLLTVEMSGLPGDFNGDGQVDAADYVVWRVGLGTIYTQADYDIWLAHFGESSGGSASGAASSARAAVPEPNSLVALLVAAMIGAGAAPRNRRRRLPAAWIPVQELPSR